MSENTKQNVAGMVDAINRVDETRRDMIAKMAATYANGLADGLALADQKAVDRTDSAN